jgi:NAD(P)H-flavin reductase
MMTTSFSPMLPWPYRVRYRRQDSPDVFTLALEPVDGPGIISFDAGQFNMLYIYGVGEVPISISGDPARVIPLIHTTRAVGTVTKAMDRLNIGDIIGVRGPYGTAWPVHEFEGRDVLVIAGGIGLAPLRPALYHLIHNRDRYGRVALLYGARTPIDLLYTDELELWRMQYGVEVLMTVDNATRDWRGSVGFVTSLVRRAPFDPHDVAVMICGPELMMRYTIQELHKRGVADANIYVTMERNMKCGIGLCGHCQYGSCFVCRDGPVFSYDRVEPFFNIREV